MFDQDSGELRSGGWGETGMSHPDTEWFATVTQPECIPWEINSMTSQTDVHVEAYNRLLQGRDRLLEATARATNVLLTLENFDEAVHAALKIITEGSGCDRICILENSLDTLLTRGDTCSRLPAYYTVIYEYAKPGILRQMDHLEFGRIPNEGREAFMERNYVRGEGFGGLVEEWDEPVQGVLTYLQVKSCYAAPIRVNGQWWGVLCVDYCQEVVRISPAEVAVLRTIADCIGSAIQRGRSQQEREQVVQQRAADLEAYNQMLLRRDQLLDATARATNVLLTLDSIDVAINSALKIVVEGVGCDRLKVMENIYHPSSPLPIRYNSIYECVVPTFETTDLHIDEVQAVEINPTFQQYFLEGDGIGGLLEEFEEPLRSMLAADQVQSSYAVPIRIQGHWWGLLCFDYCRAPIQINPAEVAVLRTVADCVGSAIQRDRTQKIILQAEQAKVAELVKANAALKQSLDVLAADPNLDRFIGHILKLIAQQFDSPLIEYWIFPSPENGDPEDAAHVHLTCWQGQVFQPSHQVDKDLPHRFSPFLDILLRVGDTNIGVLAIYLSEYRPISGQTIELAHALAQQLTLAIELTRLAQEAQQTALLQERTRLAREIHDTLAQAFGGISMQLQAATYFAATQPEKAQTHLNTAQALAKDGLAEARRSVWTLYLETAEYEDPARTIAKFIEQTTSGQSVPINLSIEGTPYRLHPDVGLNLLRIAQEAITNALRHAHAQLIQLHLEYDPQQLKLTIRDNGCGFEPQSPSRGFGLLGMQQRAARLGAAWHLVSQIGQGTTITITITNPQA